MFDNWNEVRNIVKLSVNGNSFNRQTKWYVNLEFIDLYCNVMEISSLISSFVFTYVDGGGGGGGGGRSKVVPHQKNARNLQKSIFHIIHDSYAKFIVDSECVICIFAGMGVIPKYTTTTKIILFFANF